MSTITELAWASMTRTVNEIRSPNTFFRNALWSTHEAKNTETIEIGLLSRGREIAPLVKKNGEGVMVGGHSETFQSVQPTNCRIKKPLTPSELLYNRRPGSSIFIDTGEQISAIQQHVARDLQGMADMVSNLEEYLCALALQGEIAYTNADQESFKITFPRSNSHNITLSTFWDDGTPADVDIPANVMTVKKLFSEMGLSATDVVLGSEAADTFLGYVADGHLKLLDTRRVSSGSVDFTTQFSSEGVIYLGDALGVSWWSYPRTATLNGATVNMVRPKYAEFFDRSQASERVMYYGAIADMEALEGRQFVGERFSKSWRVKDPSSVMSLIHSRPLPVPRRPDATVSMKVVSG